MDFQVGDKVVCLLNGVGKVFKIESGGYPVVVEFINGNIGLYTKEGRLEILNKFPSLFHEGTKINIKAAKPKRYPWVNIYVDKCGEVMPGVPLSTKEMALKNIRKTGCKYIDTIQLKPKGEEK